MNQSMPSSPDTNPVLDAIEDDPPQKPAFFRRPCFWIPLATTLVSLAVTAVILFFSPPTYVSNGSLWETVKLRLPDGAAFTDDRDNYVTTQNELLRSRILRQLTLNWIRANQNPSDIPLDFAGEPLDVEIQVFSSPRSSVYTVEARSANPTFTQIYLDALMKQYLEYRKNVRLEVSHETLASISEQVQKVERDLKTAQAQLEQYEHSNGFALLQLQAPMAAECMASLNQQLASLQLEAVAGSNPPLSEAESKQHQTLKLKIEFLQKSIREWETKVSEASARLASTDCLKTIIRRYQELYDRLLTLLQNTDISRNIDQDTLTILEPASSASRTYAPEKRALKIAAGTGLLIGLVMSGGLAWYRARQRKQSETLPHATR